MAAWPAMQSAVSAARAPGGRPVLRQCYRRQRTKQYWPIRRASNKKWHWYNQQHCSSERKRWTTLYFRPRPHQQQCRSNIRHCRKNRSTCSVRQCCFDIVASMDGALYSNIETTRVGNQLQKRVFNFTQESRGKLRDSEHRPLLAQSNHVTTPTDRWLVGNDVIDTYRWVHCAVTAGDGPRAGGDVAVYSSVRVNHVVADQSSLSRRSYVVTLGQ